MNTPGKIVQTRAATRQPFKKDAKVSREKAGNR